MLLLRHQGRERLAWPCLLKIAKATSWLGLIRKSAELASLGTNLRLRESWLSARLERWRSRDHSIFYLILAWEKVLQLTLVDTMILLLLFMMNHLNICKNFRMRSNFFVWYEFINSINCNMLYMRGRCMMLLFLRWSGKSLTHKMLLRENFLWGRMKALIMRSLCRRPLTRNLRNLLWDTWCCKMSLLWEVLIIISINVRILVRFLDLRMLIICEMLMSVILKLLLKLVVLVGWEISLILRNIG